MHNKNARKRKKDARNRRSKKITAKLYLHFPRFLKPKRNLIATRDSPLALLVERHHLKGRALTHDNGASQAFALRATSEETGELDTCVHEEQKTLTHKYTERRRHLCTHTQCTRHECVQFDTIACTSTLNHALARSSYNFNVYPRSNPNPSPGPGTAVGRNSTPSPTQTSSPLLRGLGCWRRSARPRLQGGNRSILWWPAGPAAS